MIVVRETAMTKFYGVSGVASKLNHEYGEEVIAREITILFYLGMLDGRRCPVVSGRRLIPDDYVPVIRQVLHERRSSRAKAQGVPT
jgi:hypothetical protein